MKLSSSKTLTQYFNNVNDLKSSGLIIPETIIEVADSNGIKQTYYITKNSNILFNISTQQDISLNDLANRNITIVRSPMEFISTARSVTDIAAKKVKEKLKNNKFVQVGKTPATTSRRIKDLKTRLGKTTNKVINDNQAEVEKKTKFLYKKANSIDFETAFKIQNNISRGSKDIVTAGLTTVEDIYDISDKDPSKRVRIARNSQTRNMFNMSYVQEWTEGMKSYMQSNDKSKTIFDMLNANATSKQVGKMQLASYMEAVTSRKKTEISSNLKLSDAELKAKNMNRTALQSKLNKLNEQPDLVDLSYEYRNNDSKTLSKSKYNNIDEAFKDRYTTLGSDYFDEVYNKAEKELSKEQISLAEMDTILKSKPAKINNTIDDLALKNAFEIGEAKLYTPAEGTTGSHVGAYLVKDPLFESAIDVARRGEYTSHYSDMEITTYKTELDNVRKEALQLGKDKSNPNKLQYLNSKAKIYEKAITHMVDIRPVARIFLDDMTRNMSSVKIGVRSTIATVLDNMGISNNITTKAIDSLDDNLSDPFIRGLTQEDLHSLITSQVGFNGIHLGGDDAAILAGIQMDFVDQYNPELKNIGSTTSVGKRNNALINNANSTKFEFTKKAYTHIYREQAIKTVLENSTHESLYKLLGRNGVESSDAVKLLQNFRRTSRSASMTDDLSNKLRSIINSNITEHTRKNKGDLFSNFRENISSLKEPTLLSRSISIKHATRMLALYASAKLLGSIAAEDPENSIPDGKHTSVETVARRIAMTDFGSPITKFGINALKLIRKVTVDIPARAKTTLQGAITKIIESTPKGIPKADYIRIHPEWKPMIQSADKRIPNKLSRIEEYYTENGTNKISNLVSRTLSNYKLHPQIKMEAENLIGNIDVVDKQLQNIADKSVRKDNILNSLKEQSIKGIRNYKFKNKTIDVPDSRLKSQMASYNDLPLNHYINNIQRIDANKLPLKSDAFDVHSSIRNLRLNIDRREMSHTSLTKIAENRVKITDIERNRIQDKAINISKTIDNRYSKIEGQIENAKNVIVDKVRKPIAPSNTILTERKYTQLNDYIGTNIKNTYGETENSFKPSIINNITSEKKHSAVIVGKHDVTKSGAEKEYASSFLRSSNVETMSKTNQSKSILMKSKTSSMLVPNEVQMVKSDTIYPTINTPTVQSNLSFSDINNVTNNSLQSKHLMNTRNDAITNSFTNYENSRYPSSFVSMMSELGI